VAANILKIFGPYISLTTSNDFKMASSLAFPPFPWFTLAFGILTYFYQEAIIA
jgi:hypothetical protein